MAQEHRSSDDLIISSSDGTGYEAGDIIFKTNNAERARIKYDGTLTGVLNAGSLPQTHVLISVGPTDPTTLPNPVPSGDEYVWMKTDGNGALLDIISGKVA